MKKITKSSKDLIAGRYTPYAPLDICNIWKMWCDKYAETKKIIQPIQCNNRYLKSAKYFLDKYK